MTTNKRALTPHQLEFCTAHFLRKANMEQFMGLPATRKQEHEATEVFVTYLKARALTGPQADIAAFLLDLEPYFECAETRLCLLTRKKTQACSVCGCLSPAFGLEGAPLCREDHGEGGQFEVPADTISSRILFEHEVDK